MAYVDWSMKGIEVSHCNCNIGCPCQFNALPSHGFCCAYVFMQIEQGHFGKVKLDGLRWGGLFSWPGPIHMGNGTAMLVIDPAASEEQRKAIETVASGQETDPGSLILQIFSTTLTKVLPTQIQPIDLSIDPKKQTAHVRVAGLVDGNAENIRNPVTGNPHIVSVKLPNGFEYTEADFLTGNAKATGPIPLDFTGTHAHIAKVHWTTHGVVR